MTHSPVTSNQCHRAHIVCIRATSERICYLYYHGFRALSSFVSTRSPSSLGHSFFLLSGIYLHQDQHVRVDTSCALAPHRYQNLSTTIMVFVCLYGFHKCTSRLVCYWQCRSALRFAIAGTCYSRAGVARAIALYRDS